MKKLLLLISLLSILLLVACADGEEDKKSIEKDTNTEEADKSNKKSESDKKEASNGAGELEVNESDIGRMTVLHKNKELNIPFETATFKGSLNKVQLGKLEVAEAYLDMFDGQEIVSVITIEAAVENTVDDTMGFYLDQATIVTDTGQQVDADLILSDDVGGEFLGKVKKEGNIIWVLKHDESISKITFHADAPHDDGYTTVGEDLKIEVPVK